MFETYTREFCEFCGSRTWNEDGICNDCKQEHLREYATIETALAWGEDEKTCVELNGFLAWNFTAAEIESILLAALTEKDKEYAEAFCMDDWMAFEEWKEKRTA